jgi:hypothetical protein
VIWCYGSRGRTVLRILRAYRCRLTPALTFRLAARLDGSADQSLTARLTGVTVEARQGLALTFDLSHVVFNEPGGYVVSPSVSGKQVAERVHHVERVQHSLKPRSTRRSPVARAPPPGADSLPGWACQPV